MGVHSVALRISGHPIKPADFDKELSEMNATKANEQQVSALPLMEVSGVFVCFSWRSCWFKNSARFVQAPF